MRKLLSALVLGAVASCAPASRETEKSVIDIDGLINRQLEFLAAREPTLTKDAGVNDSHGDTTWIPSAAAWKSELEIFRSLGMLNQRSYAGTYQMEGPLDDAHSNLLIRQFSNASAPLRWLRVYYQGEFSRIRRVVGEVEEQTPLYSAHRNLSLWFDDEQGQLVLSRYEITGYQKSALRDTVHFRIHGHLAW